MRCKLDYAKKVERSRDDDDKKKKKETKREDR